MTVDTQALPSDEIHLWVVDLDNQATRDPATLAAYDALLSPDERKKRDRFRFPKDQHQCLVTRALTRTVLSRYVDVPPEAWQFVTNDYGRPEISTPRFASWLKFNLSHTNGLVVMLVARDREIGVDVENRKRNGELLAVADRYFSPLEVKALHALPLEEQLERFFMVWTLKESYIKARGMGLSIPLAQFAFELDRRDSNIAIRFDPRLGDDPASWQFSILSYGRRHTVAIGARRHQGDEVRLVVRETVPLSE